MINVAVHEFIGYVSTLLDNERVSSFDKLVTAHLYYADLHTAQAMGPEAQARYCPTFEKSWVDVEQLQDSIEPGHPSLNLAILLAIVENRREVYYKAANLNLIPKSWHGWGMAMRHPRQIPCDAPGEDSDTRLLDWLNARVNKESACSGLLYYASAARLGEIYPDLITVPYVQATMSDKFPHVTTSLVASLMDHYRDQLDLDAPTRIGTMLTRIDELLSQRPDVGYVTFYRRVSPASR